MTTLPHRIRALCHTIPTHVIQSPVPRSRMLLLETPLEEAVDDTYVFPTVTSQSLGLHQDAQVLSTLLSRLSSLVPTVWLTIASGYLNFPAQLTASLVAAAKGPTLPTNESCSITNALSTDRSFNKLANASSPRVDILTASPAANGFYTASGIKGAVPMAYSLLEQAFYQQFMPASSSKTWDNGKDVHPQRHMYEYNRPNWTFHAKGLWVFQPTPPSSTPSSSSSRSSSSSSYSSTLVMIGSSNFGRRSYERDVESQVVLWTHNRRLVAHFQAEVTALTSQSEQVTSETWRRPGRSLKGVFNWKHGRWIRPASRVLASFL